MKLQTKISSTLEVQVNETLTDTGLDLNTLVRIALLEYCQRQLQTRVNAGKVKPVSYNTLDIPVKPLESLDNSPPTVDNTKAKLSWSEWSQSNPTKSNDEYLQYLLKKEAIEEIG